MTFTALQNLCEDKLGIIKLADIARELNVTPQVVSNWKARNQVPYKYVKILQSKIKEVENSTYNQNFKDGTVFVEYNNSADQKSDDISNTELIVNFYKKLNQKFSFICIVTLTFIVLGGFYTFSFAQPVFMSNAKIIPVSDNEAGSGMSGMAAGFGLSIPGENKGLLSPEIYPDIINSRNLLRRILFRTFKTEKYAKSLPLINILREEPNLKNEWSDKDIIKTSTMLKGMVNVNSSRKTPIISLYVHAFESKLASKMVSSLIEELNKLLAEYSFDRIKEKLKFIEVRISQTMAELSKAEEALKVFREQNRSIRTSPALLLEQNRLIRDLEVQTQIFTTLKTEHELVKIERVDENSMVLVLDHPEPSLYRESPNHTKNILLSFFFGIIISISLIFILEWHKENKNKFV